MGAAVALPLVTAIVSGWVAQPPAEVAHGPGAVTYRGRVYDIEGGTSPGLSFSRTVEAVVARRASRS
jgi:hypothetical protein